MNIHVECVPDETLIKKLGFTRKQIVHHVGKSRVFAALNRSANQLAMVDEDPGQEKTTYEKKLIFKHEANGIKYYLDNQNKNKVFVLKIKLEDWVLASCKKNKVKPAAFGLPDNSSSLHEVINYRIPAFERLLDHLLEIGNEPILTLRNWLNE